jgi:hypothetical protein
MSSEEMLKQANEINRLTSLITKLSNLQSALRDFDRLRLDGAQFLNWQDEEFQEYAADMDGIRMLCEGPAGEAVRAELTEPAVLDEICKLGKEDYEVTLGENDLRTIGLALDRALAKAEVKLQHLLGP